MKNLKILLPMLAFIFAIGMAFAMTENTEKPVVLAQDYVLVNGSWRAIPEQNCSEGDKTCRVQFGENGPIYQVYDLMNTSTLKSNTTNDPNVIPPPF